MEVQEIFNKVIDSGHYMGDKYDSSNYMCTALERAAVVGEITQEEVTKARNEINTYLEVLDTLIPESAYYALKHRLRALDLPSNSDVCKSIYMSWDTRPFQDKYQQLANKS